MKGAFMGCGQSRKKSSKASKGDCHGGRELKGGGGECEPLKRAGGEYKWRGRKGEKRGISRKEAVSGYRPGNVEKRKAMRGKEAEGGL